MALRGDRFVFRTYSPQFTVGGGEVLMSAGEKHKRRQRPLIEMLSALAKGENREIVLSLLKNAGWTGLKENILIQKSGIPEDVYKEVATDLHQSQDIIYKKSGGENWCALAENLSGLQNLITSVVTDYHKLHPAQPGISLAQLKSSIKSVPDSPFIEFTVEKLTAQSDLERKGSLFSLPGHNITLTPGQEELVSSIMQLITDAGLSALKAHPIADKLGINVEQVKDLLAIMESMGEIVRLETDTVISRELFDSTIVNLKNLEKDKGVIRLNEVMQNLGISRRVAVTFLEYTDRISITQRDGDERKFKA